jgi:hypothetical protein
MKKWLLIVVLALLPLVHVYQSRAAATKPVVPLLQGKIKAIAKAPRPGSVPYKDAIIAVHLVEVKALRGRFSQKQALVFVWGMRNNKLTPAAALKPGRILKVAVQSWEKVEGKYGGYNRRELNDNASMALDPLWGEIQK